MYYENSKYLTSFVSLPKNNNNKKQDINQEIKLNHKPNEKTKWQIYYLNFPINQLL